MWIYHIINLVETQKKEVSLLETASSQFKMKTFYWGIKTESIT